MNTTNGIFDLDTDSNGRWSVERFKVLCLPVERDANRIGRRTRRGKGNMIICSSDVAPNLQMAGVLDYAKAQQQQTLMTQVILLAVFLTVDTKYILTYIQTLSASNTMLSVTKGTSL